jgi:hypothetical protein
LTTHEEAAAVGVRRLWSGRSRSDFEDILTVLAEVGISCHSKETLTTPWLSIIFWQFMRPRSTAEYCVDVLEKDAEKSVPAMVETFARKTRDMEDS